MKDEVLENGDVHSATTWGLRLVEARIGAGSFQLDNLSFEVPIGSWCVLMGRTGSGKTTLLDAICGLRRVTAGQVWIGDREVTAEPPSTRGIGYVPQDGALFSRSSVRQHLEFGMVVGPTSVPRKEINERVDQLAALLRIESLLKRKPKGLSGGERQRVALGRALAHRPSILLLDEPLSALDDETRQEIYELLADIKKETKVTALHVTHSRHEAQQLGDMHLRITEGQVVADESWASSTPTEVATFGRSKQ